MADLDDFFAKKDKKKSKTKKFLTQEELRVKLEDTSKKATDNTVKATSKYQEENGSTANPEKNTDDEEWKEIQEEKKDYSNLKIGQLTISEANQYDSSSDVDGEDGESGTERSSVVDPWKKTKDGTKKEETKVTALQSSDTKQPKLYISPALRNSGTSAPVRSRLRTTQAPDLANEDFFPTLANARPEEQKKKKNEPAFEEVRHGGRVQHIKPDAQKVKSDEIVNRFKSLEDTDS